MVMMVHITTQESARNAERAGLRLSRYRKSVFAMPVMPNFVMTHQWTRELMKGRRGPMVGVYFRIPDDEEVVVGRYGKRIGKYGDSKRVVPASQAAAMVRDAAELGWEVEVLRPIPAKDIHAVRPVRGTVGWRHFPNAHGKKPCLCEICLRGEPNSKRLRAKLRAE